MKKNKPTTSLIIVESPTKARTLSKYLDASYVVEATMGHIRDLPKSTLGVDIEHGFTPSYLIPKDKHKRVKELIALAKKASTVILATDPDREGEAIAWHISVLLKLDKDAKRLEFHEITKDAILRSLEHPRTIDTKLVDAQQARRVLDRLVGYKLSPLLWQKLSRRWLSAGRVQSVAVRLIVEREREIATFQKSDYWTIDGVFTSQTFATDQTLVAVLTVKGETKYEESVTYDLFDGKYTVTKTSITSEQSAKDIIADAQPPYRVSTVDKREIKRSPAPPHTTSTLQQDAGRKMYFSSKRTMQLAQKLYEEGFITYHRTDSVNLSEKFITEARTYIASTFGNEFVPEQPRVFQTKSKVAQEAHEAIRPTDPNVLSEAIGDHPDFNRDHVRLYELIRKRAIASQAREAVFDSTTIRITSVNGYVFEAQGSVIKFEGFLKILGRDNGDIITPDVVVGSQLLLREATPMPHQTSPPPRYTEASLVKTLEEKDIGRPSTYAPIISTIVERQYVTKVDKKLTPTELGILVTDFLVQYFPGIMDLPFTAQMEYKLDEIANGKTAWVPVLSEFWGPFALSLEQAEKLAEKVKVPVEELGEACPDCTNPLVMRTGRYGKFIACSTFPTCHYTRQFAEKIDMKCPKCGGDIVIKKSRRGKTFYGCGNYPNCTFAAWKKEDIK